MLTGGCHCGAVRYEVKAATSDCALCHCVDCRRVSGAPAVAWFTVPTAAFRYTAGAPRRYVSSRRAERAFCEGCGCQLTFAELAETGARIDITCASLDDPNAAPPREHIWTGSRLAWMRQLDALPDRARDVA